MRDEVYKVALLFGIIFLVGCSNYANVNNSYEKALVQKKCNTKMFDENLQKIQKGDDVIYVGLNVGLIARNCGDYRQSNIFFDVAEESYKYDVDLENIASKSAKITMTTLLNDTVVDYDGSLYERIMVNAYKGLNYMYLDDFKGARVEFNRVLMRQDKAKEYFAKEIAKNRKKLEEAKKDLNYKENMLNNTQTIQKQYDYLFESFDTTKEFVNPYATYLASVFFFMDRDYRKARDLFREVAIINPKNEEIQKELEVFNAFANCPKTKGQYIFLVYENGFGTIKEEFKLSLPFIFDKKVIATSVALQTLEKREASYPLLIVNGVKTAQVVDLDNIVATEFKINMPSMIAKALTQTLLKTTLNAVVAKNDPTGGYLALGSSLLTILSTQADVRSWRGLPKSISVVMLENKGVISIKNPEGVEIFNKETDKEKNVFVFVRSFAPYLPMHTEIIQK